MCGWLDTTTIYCYAKGVIRARHILLKRDLPKTDLVCDFRKAAYLER